MAACKVFVILALAFATVMAADEDLTRPKKQVLLGTSGYPYAYSAALPAVAPAAYSAYSAYPAVAPAAYPAYAAAAYPTAYSASVVAPAAYSAPVVAPAAYSAYPAGYYGAQHVVTYA